MSTLAKAQWNLCTRCARGCAEGCTYCCTGERRRNWLKCLCFTLLFPTVVTVIEVLVLIVIEALTEEQRQTASTVLSIIGHSILGILLGSLILIICVMAFTAYIQTLRTEMTVIRNQTEITDTEIREVPETASLV